MAVAQVLLLTREANNRTEKVEEQVCLMTLSLEKPSGDNVSCGEGMLLNFEPHVNKSMLHTRFV